MDTELTTLIARPRRFERAQRGPGVLLLVVGLWSLLFGEPWGLGMAAVGAWGAAEFWRGIRVTGDILHIRGRVSRRTLPVSEIRQLGVGRPNTLWVRPRTGRTLVLHMVAVRSDRSGTVDDVHDRLRQLAEDAGADLEAEQDDHRVAPPRPRTPFLGW